MKKNILSLFLLSALIIPSPNLEAKEEKKEQKNTPENKTKVFAMEPIILTEEEKKIIKEGSIKEGTLLLTSLLLKLGGKTKESETTLKKIQDSIINDTQLDTQTELAKQWFYIIINMHHYNQKKNKIIDKIKNTLKKIRSFIFS